MADTKSSQKIGEINGRHAQRLKTWLDWWQWIIGGMFGGLGLGLMFIWEISQDVEDNAKSIAVMTESLKGERNRVDTAKQMGHYLRDELSRTKDQLITHQKDGHPESVRVLIEGYHRDDE